MIEIYTIIKEIPEKLRAKPRTVQIMCLEGVTRFGRVWPIPIYHNKPIDNRITTGYYVNRRNRSKDNSIKE